jgi:hypothetical protein
MGLAMSELPSEAAIPDCLQHVSLPEADLIHCSRYEPGADFFHVGSRSHARLDELTACWSG